MISALTFSVVTNINNIKMGSSLLNRYFQTLNLLNMEVSSYLLNYISY